MSNGNVLDPIKDLQKILSHLVGIRPDNAAEGLREMSEIHSPTLQDITGI